AFNIDRLISTSDFPNISVISNDSVRVKNNSKLVKNNLIVIDRKIPANFIRLSLDETEVDVNLKNIVKQFPKHGNILDIYLERDFKELISWQMLGAKNMSELDGTVFYRNWRNGLSANIPNK